MNKIHRVETIEEYNADGKLIRKTVTEENEEWFEEKNYTQSPYTNPYTNGPSDSTLTNPRVYYDTTTTTTLG